MAKVITMIHPSINIRPFLEDQSIRCDCMGGMCACGQVHDLNYVDEKRKEFEKLQTKGQQKMPDQPQNSIEKLESELPAQLKDAESEQTEETGEPSTDKETIIAVMGLIANWLDNVENMLEGMIPTEEEYVYLISQKTNLDQILNVYYGGAEGMDLHIVKEVLRHAKASIKACKNQSTDWLENYGVQRAVTAIEVARKVCDEALPMH